MNCDELKKEREKEAVRKRESYIKKKKKIAMIVKYSKRNKKEKCRNWKHSKNELR